MKGKIVPFIIGLLVGAILATGVFVIYQNNNKGKRPKDFDGSNFPKMTQDGNSIDMNNIPELPNGEKPSGFPSNDGQSQTTENATSETNTTNS